MLESCRICLTVVNQAEYVSVYLKVADNKSAIEIIKECSSIQVLENDSLPKHICLKCVETLNSLYTFRKLIIKSDLQLKEKLKIKNEPPELFTLQHIAENIGSGELLVTNIENIQKCKLKEEFMKSCNENLSAEGREESEWELEVESDVKDPKLKELCINTGVHGDIFGKEVFGNSNKVETFENPNAKDSVEIKKTPYECEMCHKTFRASGSLKKHLLVHNSYRPYSCEFCGKGFVENCALNIHRRIHTGDKPHSCEQCGKKFTSPSGLINHRRLHDNVEKRFYCEICNLGFYLSCQLKYHIRRHTGEKPFMCETCSQTFSEKGTLLRHRERHHVSQGEKIPCPICGKTFRYQSYLQQHIKRHSGLKPFECDDCGQKFTTRPTLKRHKLVHSGIKPHKCTVCEKSFSQAGILVRHMRIHSGEKPFVCTVCSKEFAYKHHLQGHMRNYHKEVLTITDGTTSTLEETKSLGMIDI